MLVQRSHNSAHLLVAQDLTINAQDHLYSTEEGISDRKREGEGINTESIVLLIFVPSQPCILPYGERAHLEIAVVQTYTTSQVPASSCSVVCRRDHSTAP